MVGFVVLGCRDADVPAVGATVAVAPNAVAVIGPVGL